MIAGVRRSMTNGETLGVVALGLFAPFALIVAGLTKHGGYAFHMLLFAIAAAWGFFAMLNRWLDQRGGPQPEEIDGKPNYNFGPVKFATVAAVFWGIAGFTIGVLIASQLAFPWLNLDLPWTTFGRLRPLHTSAVVLSLIHI